MSANIYKVTSILMTMSVMGACASSGSIAKVDPIRKKVELQSSSDSRSAMPDMRSERSVNSTIEKLKASLNQDPHRVSTLLNIAQLHLLQNQFKAAEDYCRRALRADLKNEEARKILAQIYFRKGNYEMASIILNNLGGMRSKDSKVLNLLGMIAIREGRNAEAREYFTTALKVNSSDIAVRMNLGVLYVKYRQLASASVEFERVLKLMPDHNDAKLHLAIIKTARGDYKTAETIYSDILNRRKDNPLALYNLAVLEKNRKNYNHAVDVLKKYLSTGYARKAKNSEVFALIEDIRRSQNSGQARVSDDEIQQMAEKAILDNSNAAADDEMSETTTQPAAEPAPTRKAKDEEISDLERLLQ